MTKLDSLITAIIFTTAFYVFPAMAADMPAKDMPIAGYHTGCGPDDGLIVSISIPDSVFPKNFCTQIDDVKGPRTNPNFNIILSYRAKFWEGEIIDGENLRRHTWHRLCGRNSMETQAIHPQFSIQSLQYIENIGDLRVRMRISGVDKTEIFHLKQDDKSEPQACG